MRSFVLFGQKARASAEFLLVDIPSTSGRLDVLLHALRAGLLISHAVRHDTLVYLVLQGEPVAPRILRVDGAAARYLRPDERSLASTAKKVLAAPSQGSAFTEVRPGIYVADGGIDRLLPELIGSTLYLLEATGTDIRSVTLAHDATFIVGDHIGFSETTRERFVSLGALPISVGPTALHSQDVIAIVANELDRQQLTCAAT
jgi:tRNA (pseudouridine54-N1)-methyltransferase